MTSLHIKISFAFIVASLALNAQQDSIPLSKKLIDTTDVKYDRLYQQFLAEKEKPIKSLWKLDLAGSGVLMPAISYEHKMGKNWSEETFVKFGLPWKDGFFPMKFEWEVDQQLKYYYNFKKREKYGQNINGFSGNYVALEVFSGEDYQPKPDVTGAMLVDKRFFYGTGLRYGMQRQIGQSAYFDIYVGLRFLGGNQETSVYELPMDRYSNSVLDRSWHLTPTLGIRAGFDLGKMLTLNKQRTEARSVWKFNLADLGILHTNIGYERFLSHNWSLDTYIGAGLEEMEAFRDNNTFFDYDANYFPTIKIQEQLRYYPAITNSLSGTYAALAAFGDLFYKDYRINVTDLYNTNHAGKVILLKKYGLSTEIGIQKTLGKIGYIDLFGGLKYEVQEYPVFRAPNGEWPGYTILTRNHFVPVIGMRAGIVIIRGQNNR
ncbi:MAG TPA: hypothetical protein VK179_20510 [Bacteroidales bacterium]|nr:hypothetical protein [Bacteroidales bacterium]